MTRAFGVVFLGRPRDASLPAGEDPPGTMTGSMAIHAAGAVVLGLAPELGFRLIHETVALFSLRADAEATLRPLAPVLWAGRALAALLLIAGLVRGLRGRGVRHGATWGCGY